MALTAARGNRATTPSAEHSDIRNARGVRHQRGFGLRGAHEAHRHPDDGRRSWCARVEQLQQAEQRGGRVANRHHRTFEHLQPQIGGGGGARGSVTCRQIGNPRIVHRAIHERCWPGSLERLTPSATIRASARTGRPVSSAARPASSTSGLQRTSAARSTIPQACTMRTTMSCTAGGRCVRFASARMVAKERR